MVFAVFWLGRLLFSRDEGGRATPWRGLLIGGVGARLMAVSVSQTVIGRTSYNKVKHMPLLLALCMALLWGGWRRAERRRALGDAPSGAASGGHRAKAGRQRSWWRIALAGVCAGLLPYTYVPADLPPGVYELRLIVYDSATLSPTVEIGVWEPEVVLARLRLVEGG